MAKKTGSVEEKENLSEGDNGEPETSDNGTPEANQGSGDPPPEGPKAKPKTKPTAKTAKSQPPEKKGMKTKTKTPAFYSMEESDIQEDTDVIAVIYDVNRDIIPGAVSGSTAIRRLSYSMRVGSEEEAGEVSMVLSRLTLKIGNNFIPRELWETAMEYFANEKSFQKRLRAKAIVPIIPNETITKCDQIDVFDYDEAILIINQTFDFEVLKGWQAKTSNPEMSEAITQQMGFLRESIEDAKARSAAIA